MYNEEHGVTFGTYHTWRDWHLIPASRPVIAPPKERTSYVTVEGMDGAWDLSQAVTGRPVFDDREGNLDFYVENDYWDWNTAYTTILNALGGRRMTVILDDDPSHFYRGACWVDKWKSDKGHSTISIKYKLYPYKREKFSSVEPWEWDTFNFDLDIIRQYKDIQVNGSYYLTVPGMKEANRATVTVTNGTMTVMVTTPGILVTYATLQNGGSLEVVVENQDYTFAFTGTGTVTVDYRGGML